MGYSDDILKSKAENLKIALREFRDAYCENNSISRYNFIMIVSDGDFTATSKQSDYIENYHDSIDY